MPEFRKQPEKSFPCGFSASQGRNPYGGPIMPSVVPVRRIRNNPVPVFIGTIVIVSVIVLVYRLWHPLVFQIVLHCTDYSTGSESGIRIRMVSSILYSFHTHPGRPSTRQSSRQSSRTPSDIFVSWRVHVSPYPVSILDLLITQYPL